MLDRNTANWLLVAAVLMLLSFLLEIFLVDRYTRPKCGCNNRRRRRSRNEQEHSQDDEETEQERIARELNEQWEAEHQAKLRERRLVELQITKLEKELEMTDKG